MATKQKSKTETKLDGLKAVMGGAVNVNSEVDITRDFDEEEAKTPAEDVSSVSEENHPSECEKSVESLSRVSDGESDIKAIRLKVVSECFARRHNGMCLRDKCLMREEYRRFCTGGDGLYDSNALLSDAEIREKSDLMFKAETSD